MEPITTVIDTGTLDNKSQEERKLKWTTELLREKNEEINQISAERDELRKQLAASGTNENEALSEAIMDEQYCIEKLNANPARCGGGGLFMLTNIEAIQSGQIGQLQAELAELKAQPKQPAVEDAGYHCEREYLDQAMKFALASEWNSETDSTGRKVLNDERIRRVVEMLFNNGFICKPSIQLKDTPTAVDPQPTGKGLEELREEYRDMPLESIRFPTQWMVNTFMRVLSGEFHTREVELAKRVEVLQSEVTSHLNNVSRRKAEIAVQRKRISELESKLSADERDAETARLIVEHDLCVEPSVRIEGGFYVSFFDDYREGHHRHHQLLHDAVRAAVATKGGE
jgi:hypothetical protein